jgi:ribulose-phosphate 3-epimerase
LHRSIHLIKEKGAKAGAVLNPATPLSALEWMLADLDVVLIMSVNPGFGGQKFIASSLEKIRRLRVLINDRGLKTLIEIDGGVNSSTVADVVRAGADVLVAGSAVFGSRDYAQTIARLKSSTLGE